MSLCSHTADCVSGLHQSPGDTGWQGKAMASWAQNAGIPLWLGEFGPHNGGGGGEYASTFASSFGYLDTLGVKI